MSTDFAFIPTGTDGFQEDVLFRGELVGKIKNTPSGYRYMNLTEKEVPNLYYDDLDELKRDIEEIFGQTEKPKQSKPAPPECVEVIDGFNPPSYFFGKVVPVLGILLVLWILINMGAKPNEKRIIPKTERVVHCQGDDCRRLWKRCIDSMWYLSDVKNADHLTPFRDTHGVHQRCE